MREIKLPVGNAFFADIRRDGEYYIDKTGLIRALVRRNAKAMLITRPRRFGKTLAMSMLSEFFDIRKDSRELFEGLSIMKDTDICAQWMNQYPTIFVSLRGVDGLSFESAFIRMTRELQTLYIDHSYLEDSDRIDESDRQLIRRIVSGNAASNDVLDGLLSLTQIMRKHFGKPVILLIDEYDVPLAKASDHGYYREMVDVMRRLMRVIKDNPALKMAVVTGCLRIAKESIFTGTNNMATNTVLDSGFGEYFGFTQEEVDQLLLDAEMAGCRSEIQQWYDGYRFGEADVYCPWDVVNYVSDHIFADAAKPKCYWNNSSDNAIIRSFIDEVGPSVTDKFETLLAGGTITCAIRDDMTYDYLHAADRSRLEENFWSVLVMTGYLTRAHSREAIVMEDSLSYYRNTVPLRIPNLEVRIVFEETVQSWFRETVASMDRSALYTAVWNSDAERMTKELRRILVKTISYYDYGEDFYHAFLAGVFVGAGYVVESNREHGEGRSDIIVKEPYESRAAVFEIKYAKNKAELPDCCEKALQQIADKGYSEDLTDMYDEILGYGIAFYKKSCLVKAGETIRC